MIAEINQPERIEKMRLHYADMFNRDYEFAQNCNHESLESVQKRYLSRGLEVFVGTTAFDSKGDKLDGFYAILTKKLS
ncbi:hypothetical protein J4422_00620 [Candidatus Pacearchaeota archaeon]|nr:hypothetical protein [Candidatus Pacearchaeota archaeon]